MRAADAPGRGRLRARAEVAVVAAALAAVLAGGCGGSDAPRRPPQVLRVTVAASGLVPEVATGVAAGDGRVLTVAHALAGRGAVRVAGRPARVLRVDDRLDLALLAVPGLRAPAVRLGGDARRVTLAVLRDGRTTALGGASAGASSSACATSRPIHPGCALGSRSPRASTRATPARRCSTRAGACSACSTRVRATAPTRRGRSTRRRSGRCSRADAGYLTRASACVYRALHVAGEPFSTRTPADRSGFVTMTSPAFL